MTDIWRSLAANAGALALALCAWTYLNTSLQERGQRARHVILGIAMGLGSVLSMTLSVKLQEGVFFDLRSVLVVISGYFGGPIGAGIAATLAGTYRYSLGGPGMVPGIVGIGLAAVLGQFGNLLRGLTRPAIEITVLSLVAGILPLLNIALLPTAALAEAYTVFAPPVCALTAVGVFVASRVILKDREESGSRALLAAAVRNTPDFYYVKNAASEFAAVNHQVAELAGFDSPSQMIGKTDRDLVAPKRAASLLAQEEELIRGGRSRLDVEERVIGPDGVERWFSSSKIALRNSDGGALGLVGLTRDVTEKRRLERELRDSNHQLAFLMNEMSVGLALFSAEGLLVFCNEQYRAMFPATALARRVGAHIRDILRLVARTGEQTNIPPDVEGWIETVASAIHTPGEQQVALEDGRWLQISTRPTGTGSSLVVVSDVTTIKESEGTLLKLTDQLKVMATTDAMTGLMNRRAFNGRLRSELARSEKQQTALAMMMVDVDWFKSYNDTYGHAAGDECLREVSRCLVFAAPRSAIVARLGGEEFAIVLPEMDEDAALLVAEGVLAGLRARALPHSGSVSGILSVSVGLAGYGPLDAGRSSQELLARADKALYASKRDGRDRATVWAEEGAVSWASG